MESANKINRIVLAGISQRLSARIKSMLKTMFESEFPTQSVDRITELETHADSGDSLHDCLIILSIDMRIKENIEHVESMLNMRFKAKVVLIVDEWELSFMPFYNAIGIHDFLERSQLKENLKASLAKLLNTNSRYKSR
ncbi:hypothetical protein FAZ15_17535 [Sphingobacterium olei]|uniref:Uncharacterized protein n=1 Tax=Sphingobacterium olei TaxID=2571155 RepID=A0A4U0NHK8_9SPHI|nr:hypothetical protein [Sphingobacterium olei]TJZ53162.1 hypothetical protein FAZ15_17535 [Sphingobacterium olei]